MLSEAIEAMARRAPGFRGAALVGMDGMPLVRMGLPDGPDLDLFAAEGATLLKQVAGSGSQAAAGRLQALLALGARWNLFLHRVTEEYFLLLVLAAEEPVGRGRYEVARAAAQVRAELR